MNLEVCRYLNIVSMMKPALLDLCALSASQVVKHGEFRKKKTPLERPLRCFVTGAMAAKDKKAKIAKTSAAEKEAAREKIKEAQDKAEKMQHT